MVLLCAICTASWPLSPAFLVTVTGGSVGSSALPGPGGQFAAVASCALLLKDPGWLCPSPPLLCGLYLLSATEPQVGGLAPHREASYLSRIPSTHRKVIFQSDTPCKFLSVPLGQRNSEPVSV